MAADGVAGETAGGAASGAAGGTEPSSGPRGRPVLLATIVWLCLVAVFFVPALLMRDRVPGALNYLTLFVLPGIFPAMVGAAVYMRAARTGREPAIVLKRARLFAPLAAFVATAATIAIQTTMDKDRSSGLALAGTLAVELLILGLVNAALALVGVFWIQSVLQRANEPRGTGS